MLWSFQAKVGHLAFDHPWVGAWTSLRDTTIHDILQKTGVKMVKLVKRNHLEFGNSVSDHVQGMHETEAIGVESCIKCRFMHQGTDSIMSDEQAIQLLDDTNGFEASQRTTGKTLVGVHFIDHHFDFPSLVVGPGQVEGWIGV